MSRKQSSAPLAGHRAALHQNPVDFPALQRIAATALTGPPPASTSKSQLGDRSNAPSLPLHVGQINVAAKIMETICTRDPAVWNGSVKTHRFTLMHQTLSNFNPYPLAAHVLYHYILPSHPSSSAPRLIRDMCLQLSKGNGLEALGDDSHVHDPVRLGTRYENMRLIMEQLCEDHDHKSIETVLNLKEPTVGLQVKSYTLASFIPYSTSSPSACNGSLPPPSALYFTSPDLLTPLHIASSSPYAPANIFDAIKTVQLLINQGASLTSPDIYSNTPLHLSSKNLNAEITEQLLKQGSPASLLNNKNQTPLQLTLSAFKPSSSKSDFNATAKLFKTVSALVQHSTNPSTLTSIDSYSMTALGYGIKIGLTDLSSMLLDRFSWGSVFDSKDAARDKLTFCKHCLFNALLSGKSKNLKVVYDKLKGDGLFKGIEDDVSAYTDRLLVKAVKLQLLKTSKLLIDLGADPNTSSPMASELWEQEEDSSSSSSSDNTGVTPAVQAIINGDDIMLNMLLDCGSCYVTECEVPRYIFRDIASETAMTMSQNSRSETHVSAITLCCILKNVKCLAVILTSKKFKAEKVLDSMESMRIGPLRGCLLSADDEDRLLHGGALIRVLECFGDYLPQGKLKFMIDKFDGSGENSVHESARLGSLQAVEFLRENGGDFNGVKFEESENVQTWREEVKRLEAVNKAQKDTLSGLKNKTNVGGNAMEFERAELTNRVIYDKVNSRWDAVTKLLEAKDRKRKTETVKGIQDFTKLRKPANVVQSKLTLCFGLVLRTGNVGSTNWRTYSPEDTLDAPSWWNTFVKGGRNFQVGKKMLDFRGKAVDVTQVKEILETVEDRFEGKWAKVEKGLFEWLNAIVEESLGRAEASFSEAMWEYIKNVEEVELTLAQIEDFKSRIEASPKFVKPLNVCLRAAPDKGRRGYGKKTGVEVSLRFEEVLNYLVDVGGDVDCPDVDGESVLTVACRKGYWGVAKRVMGRGGEVGGGWRIAGWSPLELSSGGSGKGRLEVIHELCVRGAEVTEECLIRAARSKDFEVLCMLMMATSAKIDVEKAIGRSTVDTGGRKPTVPRSKLATKKDDLIPPMTFMEQNLKHFRQALLPSNPPHALSLPIPTTSFPTSLSHCNYGSFDGSMSLISSLVSVSSQASAEIGTEAAHLKFPGGPSATFLLLGGASSVYATLPPNVAHPLKKLVLHTKKSEVVLTDLSTAPFDGIFTSQISLDGVHNFLKILAPPPLPSTTSVTKLCHAYAASGDVTALSSVLTCALSRPDIPIFRDVSTTPNESGHTALHVALSKGHVDAALTLMHAARTAAERADLSVVAQPSAQFRRLYVERAKEALNAASTAVNEASEYAPPPPSSNETMTSSRAASLLHQLKTCGRKWGRVGSFDVSHDFLACLRGEGGGEKSEWILDQLEVVRCARKLADLLGLTDRLVSSEKFKNAMHFPSTSDVQDLLPDQSSVEEIKDFLMPADWRSLPKLPASHVVAVNLELCKDGNEGFLQGSIRSDGDGRGGRVGSSDGLTIPAEVLREARAKWAVEDAAAENDQNDQNKSANASPSKRSSRFMDFVSAWRAANANETAVRAIQASELLIDWVKAIVKSKILLTAVYASKDEVGSGADKKNAMAILKTFDEAVAKEHAAAKIYTEVCNIAKKIDEAESSSESSDSSGGMMRLRCMDVVGFDDWATFASSPKISRFLPALRLVLGEKADDYYKTEECLRSLQQIDLLSWGQAVTPDSAEALKSALPVRNSGAVAETLHFLITSLIKAPSSPPLQCALAIADRAAAKRCNPLVPAIEVVGKPTFMGGDGNLHLLNSLMSTRLFSSSEPDVDGRTPIYVSAVTGNVRALHLLTGMMGGSIGDSSRPEDGCPLLIATLQAAPKFSKLPRRIVSGINSNENTLNPHLSQESYNAVLHALLDAGAKGYEFGSIRAVDLAAEKGYMSVCSRLVLDGAESMIGSETPGMSALHFACEAGEVNLAKLLVQQLKDKGEGALQAALKVGHLAKKEKSEEEEGGGKEEKLEGMSEKMKARLMAKRNSKVTTKVEELPLWPAHFAARGGHLSILELLISECSEMYKGDSELLATLGFEALECEKSHCLDTLLDVDGFNAAEVPAFNRKLGRRVEGLLEAAILRNKVLSVRNLLARKGMASASHGDLTYSPALSGENIVLCMKRGYENMAICLIRSLQARDGDAAFNVNLVLNSAEGSDLEEDAKETMLHLCARNGLEKLVLYLLGRGALANVPDAGGRTPINYSIASGHGGITRILGERNPKVLKARDLIVRKIRYFTIIKRKIKATGGALGGSVKATQLVMSSLLTTGGKL
ncbi:hypothetical protein TrST_g3450 [Triparma strigata]|uniref:Ankyrin n=1 Tax=Triparma strigata TaxID=1606541 RepID=A0A9W7A3I5_9STRA|nr:hypothetical protein TrST_g3450 [Triparma strigata]